MNNKRATRFEVSVALLAAISMRVATAATEAQANPADAGNAPLASVLATAARAESAALTSGAQPSAPVQVSPALRALLEPSDEEGGTGVSGAERDYFGALPERSRTLVEQAVADQRITSGKHLAAVLSLGMEPSDFDLVMQDNCFLCHSDPEVHSGETLFSREPAGGLSHMSLANVVTDVHFRRGLSCAGCHGGDPAEPMGHDFPPSWPASSSERRRDRSWIPAFCGRCHSDTAYMRGFDPALPTDQLEKYKESRHGKLLLEAHDSRAAQCVSCHGVHGMQSATSPRSLVHPKNVPQTCAACHTDKTVMAGFVLENGSAMPTDQYEHYRTSVHGRALLEQGDIGAPACNDCHGNHAAMPPQVASVAQICRTCHARNGSLFDGSRHKEQFEAHGWPECGKCHGTHAILKTGDHMLADGPDSLCETCHATYARENPTCNASARYFHGELTTLASALATFETEVQQLERRGLDAEPMREEVERLAESLKLSRSYVHTFERSEFDEAVAPGRASIRRIGELGEAARLELRYRLGGLAIAGGFILLTIIALWLRLRRMEKQRGF